jgi:hypothetical protein
VQESQQLAKHSLSFAMSVVSWVPLSSFLVTLAMKDELNRMG